MSFFSLETFVSLTELKIYVSKSYMEVDKIKKLEKNKAFKRSFFSHQVWQKYALVPPALVLFVSLFGVVYMYNTDRLISYYCLPFIIFLLLSTIWFKATRKYLINQDVEDIQDFSICLVLPLFKEKSKQYYLFSTGANRLNKYFLEKSKAEILDNRDAIVSGIVQGNQKVIPLKFAETDLFVTSDFKFKRNLFAKKESERYLVYFGIDKIKPISEKEIMRFL